MNETKRDTSTIWHGSNDAPQLADEWFKTADQHEAGKLVRRGRPRSANPKTAISFPVDSDVVEKFRATGAGWQARMNDALRKAAGL